MAKSQPWRRKSVLAGPSGVRAEPRLFGAEANTTFERGGISSPTRERKSAERQLERGESSARQWESARQCSGVITGRRRGETREVPGFARRSLGSSPPNDTSVERLGLAAASAGRRRPASPRHLVVGRRSVGREWRYQSRADQRAAGSTAARRARPAQRYRAPANWKRSRGHQFQGRQPLRPAADWPQGRGQRTGRAVLAPDPHRPASKAG